MNKPHLAVYEHNYIKVAQLRPSVTNVVTGSINSVNGNRILSSFYQIKIKIDRG